MPVAAVAFAAIGAWFMHERSGEAEEPQIPGRSPRAAKSGAGRTNDVKATRIAVNDRVPGGGNAQNGGSTNSAALLDGALLRSRKEELAEEKAITSEILDLFVGLEMTPERQKVYDLRRAIDRDNRREALKIIRDIMDSKDKLVRRHALAACAQLGKAALSELTHMLADPDPSIASDALDAWQVAFGEVEGEADKASVVVEMIEQIDERVQAWALLMNLTRMNRKVAVNAVTEIIEGNKGTVVEDVGREMYEHLTGGDTYTDANSGKRYLERVEEEARVIAAEWNVFDHAVRAGKSETEAAIEAFGPISEADLPEGVSLQSVLQEAESQK